MSPPLKTAPVSPIIHVDHWSPDDQRWYFAQPSRDSNPGGMDGHFEVIRAIGPRHRWNTDNTMVALVKDERLAEHVAKMLARYPLPRQ